MKRVPAFYRIMEDHVLASISIQFKISDLERALARIYLPGFKIAWKELAGCAHPAATPVGV